MKAQWKKYTLEFKQPSGTSRGILHSKTSWFIILETATSWGIGECGYLAGLSIDPLETYEAVLETLCQSINRGERPLPSAYREYPSIRMGLEMAYRSLEAEDPMLLYPSEFTKGQKSIPINGLVWMGSLDFMQAQIEDKLNEGYDCIKMKIGSLDFQDEYRLLKALRARYPADVLTLRVDANGAYSIDQAQRVLDALAKIEVHSIEQPIAAGNIEAMARLCAQSPVPIALDEELIGHAVTDDKAELLAFIKPQYIILKPSLLGGFTAAEEWIASASKQACGWWITSALESNIGLNALAQWTATLPTKGPQGLGTGSLYTNNISGSLAIKNGYLVCANSPAWAIPF